METAAIYGVWAPTGLVAQALRCHEQTMRRWAKEGIIECRHLGPRRTLVNVPQAVKEYEKRYPRVAIDRDALGPYLNS